MEPAIVSEPVGALRAGPPPGRPGEAGRLGYHACLATATRSIAFGEPGRASSRPCVSCVPWKGRSWQLPACVPRPTRRRPPCG